MLVGSISFKEVEGAYILFYLFTISLLKVNLYMMCFVMFNRIRMPSGELFPSYFKPLCTSL